MWRANILNRQPKVKKDKSINEYINLKRITESKWFINFSIIADLAKGKFVKDKSLLVVDVIFFIGKLINNMKMFGMRI